MTTPEAELWRDIHRRIAARRVKAGLSWKELEKKGGVSQRTLYKMRDDGVPLQSSVKRAKLCIALGWTAESLNDIEAGGEPTLLIDALAEIEARIEFACDHEGDPEEVRALERTAGSLRFAINPHPAFFKPPASSTPEQSADNAHPVTRAEFNRLRRQMNVLAGRLGLVLDELDVDEMPSLGTIPAAPTADRSPR